METYEGVKFETLYVDKRPPVAAAAGELLEWCQAFVTNGFASTDDEAAGNLSCRLDQGFLITPTHVPFSEIGLEDFVHVLEVRDATGAVLVKGTRPPSSEARMHSAIYAARPEIEAVFHGHSPEIVDRGESLGLVSTPKEVSYGSPELAQLAAEAAAEADFFVLKGHGFVALGRTMDEAGEEAIGALRTVRGATST